MNRPVNYLSEMAAWTWQTSLQACLVIILILAVQYALGDRLSPRWRYALWMLLVLRLALPWAPQSPTSAFNLLPTSSPLVADKPPTRIADTATRVSPPETKPATSSVAAEPVLTRTAGARHENLRPVPNAVAISINPSDATEVPRQQFAFTSPLLWRSLPLVWFAGVLLVLAWAVAQSHSLAGAVRRQRLVTDPDTLALLEDCKQAAGVYVYLAVLETPRVSGPALFGILRPSLLLPPGTIATLSREQLRHVFLHELAHVKRHDIAVNWLMAVLQCLHWFNPLVWYGFSRMRADREVACDALALSFATPDTSREYGRTFVYLLEHYTKPRRMPSLAGIMEKQDQMKRRIRMIARFDQAPRTHPLLAALLFAVLGAVSLTSARSQVTQSQKDATSAPATAEQLPRTTGQILAATKPDVAAPATMDETRKLLRQLMNMRAEIRQPQLTFLDSRQDPASPGMQMGWNLSGVTAELQRQQQNSGASRSAWDTVGKLQQRHHLLSAIPNPQQRLQQRIIYNQLLQGIGLNPSEVSDWYVEIPPFGGAYFNDAELAKSMPGAAANRASLARFGIAIPALQKLWVMERLSQSEPDQPQPVTQQDLEYLLEVNLSGDNLAWTIQQLQALTDIIRSAKSNQVVEISEVRLVHPGDLQPPASGRYSFTTGDKNAEASSAVQLAGVPTPVPADQRTGKGAGIELNFKATLPNTAKFLADVAKNSQGRSVNQVQIQDSPDGLATTSATVELISRSAGQENAFEVPEKSLERPKKADSQSGVNAALGAGSWEERPSAEMLPGRSSNSAVWTGNELIVFGGEGMNVSFDDGARYNPDEHVWRPLPRENAPGTRTCHTGIWTGKEMIAWGGFGGSYGNDINRGDGARFSPETNTWRPVTITHAPSARFLHSALWTGYEMLVWGGYTDSHAMYAGCHVDAHLNSGGRYNPYADEWTSISLVGAPGRRLAHAAVWTGDKMIVWGGANAKQSLNDGAIYDPRTDSWTPMSTDGAPGPRSWPVAVWTGSEMIVWGGADDKTYYRDGARYDPATDKWTPISAQNAPTGRTLTRAVWTGKEMILWGGVNDDDVAGLNDVKRYVNTGGRYNPGTDTWTPITLNGAPSGRLASNVWTGEGLLLFGGYNNVHRNDTWYYRL